jgi:hypothetical protein
MGQHTSGSWFVNGPSNVYAKVDPTERRANGELIPPLDKCIAHVVQGYGVTDEEWKANANLIASAPDLADALRAIRARINGEWDDPALMKFGPLNTDRISDILTIVADSLAKAEGRR